VDIGEGAVKMTRRVVCYINQFFAGMGGEEQAHVPPSARPGTVGPAMQVQSLLGEEAVVVGTVICGDSYFGEHLEEARAECVRLIGEFKPDLLVAGPAFNAGRYGVACGDICSAVTEKLGIPSITGMYRENPGVELYSPKTFIVKTSDSARGMKDALGAISALAVKILKGTPLGAAEDEGYFPRGIRKNFFHETNGAKRAVDMLLRKLAGKPFSTEYEMPVFKRIPPAEPVKDLKNATIALVSSGGIVPRGNPDHIRVSSAESYGVYDISSLDDLTPENFESIHGGYDRVWANEDPDTVLPLDIMREMEREGVFGKLYDNVFTTTGTGTAVAHAERFGQEIGERLKKDGVDAVILTST
jgi:glycine reductase